MAILRDTQARAKRIDLTYFKRITTLGRWKWGLSLLALAGVVVWLGTMAVQGDHRVYPSGSLSAAHAMLETNCAACHTSTWRSEP